MNENTFGEILINALEELKKTNDGDITTSDKGCTLDMDKLKELTSKEIKSGEIINEEVKRKMSSSDSWVKHINVINSWFDVNTDTDKRKEESETEDNDFDDDSYTFESEDTCFNTDCDGCDECSDDDGSCDCDDDVIIDFDRFEDEDIDLAYCKSYMIESLVDSFLMGDSDEFINEFEEFDEYNFLEGSFIFEEVMYKISIRVIWSRLMCGRYNNVYEIKKIIVLDCEVV